jgi:hypothetical protein
MTVSNRRWRTSRWMCGILALAASSLYAQAPAAESDEAKPRKWAIGIRARTMPIRKFSVMDNGQAKTTTTVSKTVYDWNFNTTSRSFLAGGGLALEGALSRRVTVTAELLFNRLRYDKVTDIYWGTDDPTTSADERSHKSIAENTKARLFDVPLLAHVSMRESGWLSHFYLAGGATARLASTVRTTNNITNADATKENNQIRAQLSKRTLFGATVGIGFRFVDEFHIKVTPEVRYTRWAGSTFGQDSTRSPRDQLELGIGFSR